MSSRKWYEVTVVETVVHKIPVKAKNEEQADRKAGDLFTNEGGEPFYHHSDWEIALTRKEAVHR